MDVGKSVCNADVLVLFGVTGDLAAKFLFPALYRMAEHGELDVPVVGVARPGWDDARLRESARRWIAAAVPVDEAVWARLAERISIVTGDLTDPGTYARLRERLGGRGRIAHYLAIPPSLFAVTAAGLAAAGLNRDAWLVVEKPYGHDRESARTLDTELRGHFSAGRIFRVDHFLGDEAVEGIKVARFANTLLHAIWNRGYVDNVQITLAEDFDVAGRGSFYDPVGAIRDVLQNHLLQVLALLTMEPPAEPSAAAEEAEKHRVLRATRTIQPSDIIRGQYQGYLDVPGVRPGSRTETFFALRAWIDNWRWSGVPFYIRGGKCLAVSGTEVVAQLRRPAIELYPGRDGTAPPDLIRFRLEPDAGMTFDLVVNDPTDVAKVSPVRVPVRVDYSQVLGPEELPYENILRGAVQGAAGWFAGFGVIDESWRIVAPVLGLPGLPAPYQRGGWGPATAVLLPGPAGWQPLERRAASRPLIPAPAPAAR